VRFLAVDVYADHHPAVVHLTERMKRVKLEDDTVAQPLWAKLAT
jgi:hypothetical protein